MDTTGGYLKVIHPVLIHHVGGGGGVHRGENGVCVPVISYSNCIVKVYLCIYILCLSQRIMNKNPISSPQNLS